MNIVSLIETMGEMLMDTSSVFGVGMIALLVLVVASYFMNALALYTIAKYRKIANPWLAWIPLLQIWTLGAISDHYQQTEYGEMANRRKVLLLLQLIPAGLSLALVLVFAIAGLRVGTALLAVCLMLAIIAVSIVKLVLQYRATFDVYRSNDASTAVFYLILSLAIPITMPFFLLATCDRIARRNYCKVLVKIGTYTFLGIMALIVLFPFYWMIISSLKTLSEYREAIPTFWPRQMMFSNYSEAFTTANLGNLFVHTLIVGVVSTILSLVITVLSAFAFARLEFKGKEAMFGLLLATMMIPGELFTITNYITVVNRLSWENTYAALIVPFLVSVFYIYLLRQNFMQIPNELYLAAKVDGCKDLKYLWKVMIPLALPTLISITILKMMGAWNSYIWPKLVANDDAHQLITNGLRNAFTDTSGQANYPVQMAAVAIVSAPLFLVFLFLRKYIMKGVSRSGIKG